MSSVSQSSRLSGLRGLLCLALIGLSLFLVVAVPVAIASDLWFQNKSRIVSRMGGWFLLAVGLGYVNMGGWQRYYLYLFMLRPQQMKYYKPQRLAIIHYRLYDRSIIKKAGYRLQTMAFGQYKLKVIAFGWVK
jgi:photosystem II core protein PsbZ